MSTLEYAQNAGMQYVNNNVAKAGDLDPRSLNKGEMEAVYEYDKENRGRNQGRNQGSNQGSNQRESHEKQVYHDHNDDHKSSSHMSTKSIIIIIVVIVVLALLGVIIWQCTISSENGADSSSGQSKNSFDSKSDAS